MTDPCFWTLLSLQGVQGISDIITIPGLVNVDFADVKAIMCNSGTAMLGVGVSSGRNRAEEAALVGSCSRQTLVWFCCSPRHARRPAATASGRSPWFTDV